MTSNAGPSRISDQPIAATAQRFPALAVCALLALAVVLVFGQTVRHGFLNLDDNIYVYENAQVSHGLSVEGTVWAFTRCHATNWHPLTWLSLMADCQMYGLNAGGHHVTNVVLHAAAAVLLFLALWHMTGACWSSAFVAALFAIHPLRVESVAWVTERKDVLSGLFFMATLAAYVHYVRRPFSLGSYLLVAALFALGLMAKPMLVTLPFVLLLLDYWPLGRMTARRRASADREAAAAAAGGHVVRGNGVGPGASDVIGREPSDRVPDQQRPGLIRRLPGPVVLARGTGPLLSPSGAYLPVAKVMGAVLVLAGITAAALAGWRRRPYLIVGWLWYVGMLVPVSGLSQAGQQAMADRYSYLPQIGLCLALTWAAADLCRRGSVLRWACGVASAAVLAALIGCAWRQTSFWGDAATLWTHTLACTSRNEMAHSNLGEILQKSGRFEQARVQYQRAVDIQPDDAEAHCDLGEALRHLNRFEEALAQYRKGLEIRPGYAVGHNNLGTFWLTRASLPQPWRSIGKR